MALAVALFVSLALSPLALAADSPPLECPQCGQWDVSSASPSGAVGERIVIDAGSVEVPTCGQFEVTAVQHAASVGADGRRTYRVVLTLRPAWITRLCGVSGEGAMRLEAEIGVGYLHDGGLGTFQIYGGEGASPRFVATAWNARRDDPCGSGSGRVSSVCLEIANARLMKELAYEAYSNYDKQTLGRPKPLGWQFNATRFAAEVLAFCTEREVRRGGGAWPYVWALDCQSQRLNDKLHELRAWRACRLQRGNGCKVPDHDFDRSPRVEP